MQAYWGVEVFPPEAEDFNYIYEGCYASLCITGAACSQSTNFSNGPPSYSILKRVLLKRQ
jgi:hypothetical protein